MAVIVAGVDHSEGLYNGALVRYLDFSDSYFAPAKRATPSSTTRKSSSWSACAPASGAPTTTWGPILTYRGSDDEEGT